MSLLTALIIGGIVGWLAAQIAGRDEGLIGSIAIGVVGAIIGSFLAQAFGSTTVFGAISLPGIVWAFIGSLILVVILNAFQYRSHRI
jgi:uncharacterized membrane protein YeaQ/YmgE (transglycosylase-associated protein family)